MKPTQTLMAEHQVILKALDRLRESLQKARDGAFDAEALTVSLSFFREYADKRHHGKEEDKLFPAMNRRGMPLDGGPLHCMLEEHTLGRSLLKIVGENLPGARAGDETARGAVVDAYAEYEAFLRDHIFKEDNILFRMADQVLTPEDQAALEKEFAAFDAADPGARERQAAAV